MIRSNPFKVKEPKRRARIRNRALRFGESKIKGSKSQKFFSQCDKIEK